MREQIAEFLSQGYKPAQIAGFCGCSEQYISELVHGDESFREILREKMLINVDKRINNRYNELEELTLKALKENIAACDIGDLTQVLSTIAKVKNASKLPPAGTYSNPTLGVTLVFPQQQIPQVVTDDGNRVVAIGTKTMMPMPAKAVKDMFARMDEAEAIRNVTIEDVRDEPASARANAG